MLLVAVSFCCVDSFAACTVWQNDFELFANGVRGRVPSGGSGDPTLPIGGWLEAQWGEGWVGVQYNEGTGMGRTGSAAEITLSINQLRTPTLFQSFNFTPGNPLEVSAWVNDNDNAEQEGGITMGIGWYDYSGTGTNYKGSPSQSHSYQTTSNPAGWTQLTKTYTPNTDPDPPAIFFIASANAGFGETRAFFDDLLVVDTVASGPCISSKALLNGTFEGNFIDGVAADWFKWVASGNPSYVTENTPIWVHGGSKGQRWWDGGQAFDAGLYQEVTQGVGNGVSCTFSAWMHAYRADSGNATLSVGIDPNGGANLNQVSWSSETQNPSAWTQLTKQVAATGSAVTCFVRGQSALPVYGERDIFVDDATFSVSGTPVPTTPAASTPTPTTPSTGCSNALGDANCDGGITPGDALLAFNLFLGINPAGTVCGGNMTCIRQAADVKVDGNGNVTPGDALCIFNKFLGSGNLPC